MSTFQDDPDGPVEPFESAEPVDLGDEHSTSFKDVKQLGLFAAIASLSYVFWVVGGMEMVERLAFYGVKAVATLYAKDPVSEGGLGVNLAKFGTLLMVWAFVQSVLPIFTGGLSDRYGYKQTIFLSTVLKIIGYLLMAWFPTYWGFFWGAVVLATGTAIFKPGIQGTLVKSTTRRNSSMAWGIFYQLVNIGGFLGPLVAGLLRKMEWTYVFYACAGIICINFLLLLTYKEVGKEERLERNRLAREGRLERPNLAKESIQELIKPHVWTYLLLFSGFWFMFMALFDVLPAHIDDWVDTSDIIQTLFAGGTSENAIVNFFVITNAEGTAIQPEGMLNLNAGLIMTTCFIFAWISGLMRATTSIV
ncbi:MAG: MFS transporter, partial [Planctomycetota bacterium]